MDYQKFKEFHEISWLTKYRGLKISRLCQLLYKSRAFVQVT